MEKEEFKITIAGKSYPLNLDNAKRELYLLAEQRVNNAINRYQKQNFKGFSMQDAVALTAFELAVMNISIKQNTEIDSPDLERLREMDQRIAEYLNDLNNEK